MARQLQPHLSYLLYRLSETGRLFINLYDVKGKRMQAIVGELGEIAGEVKEMQEDTNKTIKICAVFGGLGIVVVAAVLLGHGLLGGEGAANMAALGMAIAFGGGAAIITVRVIAALTEKIRITTVEQLVKEFMTLVELQKNVLDEINMVSEALHEKSSSLMTTTGAQAKTILMKTQQLQLLLRQAAELAKRSKEVMDVTLTIQWGVRELLNSIINIIPIPEEDAELRNCITSSAFQCAITATEFAKMRNMLKDFEEM